MTEKIEISVKEDNSLHALSNPAYIDWPVGDEFISLDGEFTLEDLEFLVAHIKAHRKEAGNSSES